MKACHITLSFLRVPRFFFTLLFWPLFLGLLLAGFQLFISTAYLETVSRKAQDIEADLNNYNNEENFFREMVYGSNQPINTINLCIWKNDIAPINCKISNKDAVIRVKDSQNFDYSQYQQLFEGVFTQMHVCSICTSDFIVIPGKDENNTIISNLKGLFISELLKTHLGRNRKDKAIAIRYEREKQEELLGRLLLKPRGLDKLVDLSNINKTVVLVFNVGILMVIAFYLALRSHRRVLDYFAKNGALLPLVAACGKEEFYRALWIITSLRVFGFLLASIPATISVFMSLSASAQFGQSILADSSMLLLWFISIGCGMATLTIIASISELKARHLFFGFLYKIITVLIIIVGATIWALTLFFSGSIGTFVQQLTTALPIFGLCPVLLAPIIPVEPVVLAFHTILSGLVVVVLIRLNSNWFATHLEEL